MINDPFDPLAQYRKTPPVPKASIMQRNESDEYAAFGTRDKVQRLRICGAAALVHSPGYNVLLDVVSDGRNGTYFILVYTALLVRIKGANLQKMIFAIENAHADFIQEFDPERWKKPTDATAPFIESIEIKVTTGGAQHDDMTH